MDLAVEETLAVLTDELEKSKAPLAVLTADELDKLNLASDLHALARRNFEQVWAPIKAAHGLPDGTIVYNRGTGEVVDDG